MVTPITKYCTFFTCRERGINVGKVIIQIRHIRRIGSAITFIGCVVEHRDPKSLGKNFLPNSCQISHSSHIPNFCDSWLAMVGIKPWASFRDWYHSPPALLGVRSSKWTIGCTAFGAAFTVISLTPSSNYSHQKLLTIPTGRFSLWLCETSLTYSSHLTTDFGDCSRSSLFIDSTVRSS